MATHSSLLKTNKYDWVVVDLRDNFGGSLTLLYLMTYHLFGGQVSTQFTQCSENAFATQKTIM